MVTGLLGWWCDRTLCVLALLSPGCSQQLYTHPFGTQGSVYSAVVATLYIRKAQVLELYRA